MQVVAHNLAAMFTDRQLKINTGKKAKSTEKLSSGYKINRASDDAAGLAISEKMRKKIRGLNRGAENIQDGVSLVQIADGALAETQEMLQRMNELTIQAANGTNSESDRHAINQEINQLKMEIDRVADTTSFNDSIFPLRDGDYSESHYVDAIEMRPEKMLVDDIEYQQGDPITVDEVVTVPGTAISTNNITFPDFDYSDAEFDARPFNENTPLETLSLFVKVDGTDTAADGNYYSLLYTGGSATSREVLNGSASKTSYPSILYNYDGATGSLPKQVRFRDIGTLESFSEDLDAGKWERVFSYTDPDDSNVSFNVKQTVSIDSDKKQYNVDTEIINTGSKELSQSMIVMNFDTSYKGGWDGDHNEGYYLDETGAQIEKQSLFTDSPFDSDDVANMAQLEGDASGSMTSVYNRIASGQISSDGSLPSRFIVGGKDKGDSDEWMPFAMEVKMNPPAETTAITSYAGVTALSVSGTPTDTFVEEYFFDVTDNAILVNGHEHSFDAIVSTNGDTLDSLNGGTYSLNENGVTFSLKIADGSSIQDIKESLQTAQVGYYTSYYAESDMDLEVCFSIDGDDDQRRGFEKLAGQYSLSITDNEIRVLGAEEEFSAEWDLDKLVQKFNRSSTMTSHNERILRNPDIVLAGKSSGTELTMGYIILDKAPGGTSVEVSKDDFYTMFEGAMIDLRKMSNGLCTFEKTLAEGDVVLANPTVRGLSPVEKIVEEGDNSNGDFLIIGQYDGSNKLDFLSNYSGNGSNIYGQDHTFSYGTFGMKNSMSIGIIDTSSMIDPGTNKPVVPGEIEVHRQRQVIPQIPVHIQREEDGEIPVHVLNEETKHIAGKQVKIQNSDEVADQTHIHLVNATCKGLGIESVDVSTEDLALKSIDTIGKGLNRANEYRSYFGAMQNRLEHSMSINKNSSENLQAAESRIRDTDIAKEMVSYSLNNIVEQAAQGMLAQANQQTQGALSLLQ